MTVIGDWLDGVWDHAEHAIAEHVPHRPQPTFTPNPAQPATMAAATAPAPNKENRMNLTQIEDDVRTDLTDGLNWLDGFVQRVKAAAPGIITTVDAVSGSTVGQLAEIFLGKILPPDVEAEFIAIAKRYAATFGQPAAPAAPAAPPQQ